MAIDRRLLEILCCPVSKRSLQPMRADQLQCVNAAITAGDILDVDGRRVVNTLQSGLITDDGRVLYRVEDDIPVLLPEDGIGTTQMHGFPE